MNRKYHPAKFHDLIQELASIESVLNRNIDTTLWISDPHGAGRRFISILKGRFGLVWRTVYEALPKIFSPEKLEYLDRIIRREQYYENPGMRMERQDVIASLAEVIRYKVNSVADFDLIRPSISSEMKPFVENLLLNFPVPDIVYENNAVADMVIASLSRLVKQVVLKHLILLGDVFDRGDEPDKIIRIIAQKKYRPFVTFVWGNHDILWMGAAAGNKSLIAEALRVTARYDNLEFLERLNINLQKLKDLSEKLYPGEITGNFKAKMAISRKIEKTLAIIQFRLEEKTIQQYPQMGMGSRLNLEYLAEKLKNNDLEGLTDFHFPTIDPENPHALTAEERDVIDDLAEQFTSSTRIKRLMEYLFLEGKLYHVNNYILNIHALIPSTQEGTFDELYGQKGRGLFDHIEATVKSVGKQYLNNKKVEPFQLAVMFYLWCGPKSPFFGKHAMKTFERYFYSDKTTHEEHLLYWSENLRNPAFMDMILKEFGAKRIVFGHTPVNVMKGEKIATEDGKAINIDGGFSEAYLGRGHSLIQTPHQLYAIILPTQDEMDEAERTGNPAPLQFEDIDFYNKPRKVKDSYTGNLMLHRRNELLKEIDEMMEEQ
jgi:fructose-1,6-bisphosphatase III